MASTGPLDHIDLSVSDPARSIIFYGAFFSALGYRRMRFGDMPDFGGDRPRRACWGLRDADGGYFCVEVRPAAGPDAGRRHDRYAPGPHHLAFKASGRKGVDAVHASMVAIGAEVLDAPRDYGGAPGYPEDCKGASEQCAPALAFRERSHQGAFPQA